MSVEVLSVRGLKPECGKVDRDLWLWFLEAKKDYKNYHGPRVTKRMVQNKAMQAFRDAGITGFKASDGWYVRWIKRWHRFGCDNVDKDHDASPRESNGNTSSSKKRPFKRRNTKKSGNKVILSIPGNIGKSQCLPNEQDLYVSSSSSYPIDKLQILHDVASRELADTIFQEMNAVETRSNSFEQSSHLLSETSQPEQSDSSSLLDFDQITWNDIPYVDKPELSANPNTLYRIDENNLNYSSSVMSQMMEFAEICHLKEKEMDQQHNNIQDQVLSKQQVEDQPFCEDFHLIQHQGSLNNAEAKNFPIIQCSSNNSQSFSCNSSEYLSENPFFSMDDSSFHILDNNHSDFDQHCADYQSDKSIHAVQKEDINCLLNAAYCNQVNIHKLDDSDLKGAGSTQSVDTRVGEKHLSSPVNIIKVSGCEANLTEKAFNSNGKNIDIVSCKSDHMSVIGLGCLNVEDPDSVCCSEGGNIGLLFGQSYESDHLNVVGFNSLNFNEETVTCASARANFGVMHTENHLTNEMDIIKFNNLNLDMSGGAAGAEDVENASVCDKINDSNVINESELNDLIVCEKESSNNTNDVSVGFAQNCSYQPDHVNVIGVNLDCPSNLSCVKRSNLGVVYNNDYEANQVNIIELNNFNSTEADVLCSFNGDNVVYGGFNHDRMNIVELDSFNVDAAGSMEEGVVMHTDFQPDQVSIIELSNLNLEGADRCYSDRGEINNHSDDNIFPSPLPRTSIPCGQLRSSSVDPGSHSPHSSSVPPSLDSTNSESPLLLFAQSPFSFNDDGLSDVLPLPSSNGKTHDESKSEDGTVSDLDLVDSVILDQVRMEDLQNQRLKIKVHSSDKATITDANTISKDQLAESEKRPPPRRLGGERYLPCFKRKVLEYAAQHTAKDAAKQFHVHADTLTLWSRNKESKGTVASVLPDQQMLTWLRLKRESGILLTRDEVCNKAKELLQTPGPWQKDKSRWFHVWGARFTDFDKAEECNVDKAEENVPIVQSSFSKALYPDEFKVEVARFAERTSQNLASSVFNIARRRIFEWLTAMKAAKKVEEGDHLLHKVPPAKGKGFGRALTSTAVDRELWEWFCKQTAKKSKPKSREIRSKAVELFRAHKYEHIRCSFGWFKRWSIRHGVPLRYEGDSDLLVWCLEQFDHNRNISHRDLLNQAYHVLTGTHKSDFKASAGWALRFCKRHRLLLSSRPSFEVELPDELEDRVEEFRTLTKKLIHSIGASPESIGSMDEIPLNFTAGGSGSSRSRLLLRRSGFENCHATVVLCCVSDGTLLPPTIIFKGLGPPEWVTVDGVCLLVLHQDESCMNASTMLQWLQFVWLKNIAPPSVLVLDCFEPHTADNVKETSLAKKCQLSIIPAGCSSKLQPLDMSVTRQFEAIIADRWAKHYASLDHFSTNKRSSYSSNSDIIRWVADAHSQLQRSRKDPIQCSFGAMGLTGVRGHSNNCNSESTSSLST